MARYSGKKRISEATREEGMRIARSTQRPEQTKEQTKLIAAGIQRGIDLYKKQQKAKARENALKLRKEGRERSSDSPASAPDVPGLQTNVPRGNAVLAWTLLALTWLGIGAYVLLPWLQELTAG